MRRPRGFTLIELAVVISISALVVPAVFLLARAILTEHDVALSQLEVADSVRAIGEELRLDLRTGRPSATDPWRIEGAGKCFPVEYRLEAGVLIRHAPPECGADRALARRVAAMTRNEQTVALEFDGPKGSTRVAIALGGGR